MKKKLIAINIFRSYSNAKAINAHFREVVITKRFTQNELDQFSNLTGDHNPIHTQTTNNETKVHGAFLNAIVAGIMGTKLPGHGTIVLEQNYKFPKACHINVDTEIRVRLVQERKISIAEYVCKQNEDIVLEGVAKLLTKNFKNSQ